MWHHAAADLLYNDDLLYIAVIRHLRTLTKLPLHTGIPPQPIQCVGYMRAAVLLCPIAMFSHMQHTLQPTRH